ncbi:hypothetical protein [Beijerinckia sp. L45]|uniref:hypothetical protein n=1 Tax=Beijerinckia sp. L45 TaxID=1641855 RepID=UPI001AEDF871|nr:hypothetical protein [Beijerinckia sp. L45]
MARIGYKEPTQQARRSDNSASHFPCLEEWRGDNAAAPFADGLNARSCDYW